MDAEDNTTTLDITEPEPIVFREITFSKSYEIGSFNHLPEHKLYAQACAISSDKYSIRVIVAPEGQHNSKWQLYKLFHQMSPEYKMEDFIFDTYEEAENKLSLIANTNNIIGIF